MGIFSALFSSKPKPSASPAKEPAAAKPAKRPLEQHRVVATSGAPMAKANGATAVPKPVPSAAALQMPQPVLPRSITQRLTAHPALPPSRSQHALPARGESSSSIGEVTLTVADVIPQIPVAMLAQNAPVDLTRPLYFSMAAISAEMARGRPAVPLSSVARQCPEIFRHPESIDSAEMLRLPLQKLLEQIGKLKRIDYANTPRALPPSPSVEAPKPLVSEVAPIVPVAPVVEAQPRPIGMEPKSLPSWLQANHEPVSRNGHAPMAPLPRPSPLAEKPAESPLKLFKAPPTDTAETITAEIIEIVPTKVELVSPPVEDQPATREVEASEPLAGSRVEDYEVPTIGEAPVVEVAESEDEVLDVLGGWPVEIPEEDPLSLPTPEPPDKLESISVLETPAVDPLTPPAISASESALAEPLHLPTPTIHTKVESGNFIVVGPFIPKTSVSHSAWIEHEAVFVPPPSPPPSLLSPPVLPVPPSSPILAEALPKIPEIPVVPEVLPAPATDVANVSELPAEAKTVAVPAPTVPVEPTPAPTVVPPVAPVPPSQPARTAELVAPRPVSAPVIPKFPFRAPRAILKSARATETVDRPKPKPPRSPVFQAFAAEEERAVSTPAKPKMPGLFGANPLDRYFSTKVSPPVNWAAAGALLSVAGEVTPSKLAGAISKLPGMTACLLVAPPLLTVSGAWPESMGVDNSLAFGRRLAVVLKQSNASIVSHRQIPVDAGTLLVFAIDDLLVCALSHATEISPAIRQRLLVVAKAMAHARQAVRKSEEEEFY